MAIPAAALSAHSPIQGYTFIDPNKPRPRRYIIAVDAIEKDGKTHFALSAPGSLAYMDFDNRSEGTIEEFLASGKKIAWRTKPTGEPWPYQIPSMLGASDEKAAQIQAEARAEWGRFEDDFERAIASPQIDSVIVDTASDAWKLVRLGAFGRLVKVPPHLYEETNGAYRRLITLARQQTKTNLVLVHKLKDEWANTKGPDGKLTSYTTGAKERSGFGETGFMVDVNAVLYRLPQAQCVDGDLGFRMSVTDCGANPRVRGLVLANEMITFDCLVAAIENM